MKTSLRAASLGIAIFTVISLAYGGPPDVVPPTSDEWEEIYVPTSRAPIDLEVGSKLRNELFELLRAKAGPTTRFSGSLKAYRNWAYFLGRTVDEAGNSQKNPPAGNDDAVGLWLRTQEGWSLVAHSFGHSDAFYVIWPEQFGAPRELLGMSAKPEVAGGDATDAGKDGSPAPEAASRPSTVKLSQKLAQESVGYGDLNAMAARAGIDYPALLEKALQRERSAVFLLLWMAGNAHLDGAGAEGYTHTMVQAARIIGDEMLGDVSHSLDRASLGPLRDAFLFEYGGGNDRASAVKDAQKDFPKLWAVLSDNEGGESKGK